MNTLVLAPRDWFPSGVPQLAEQLVGALIAHGSKVRLLLQEPSMGVGLLRGAQDFYAAPKAGLSVQWVPKFEFASLSREALLHRLEGVITTAGIDRVLAVGVRRWGYVGSVAARLTKKPMALVLTYRDVFEHHLNAPQELEIATQTADVIASPNALILSHLECFYPIRERSFVLDTPPLFPGTEFEPCSDDLHYRSSVTRDEPYLCTTGHLSPLVHGSELLDRVVDLIRDGVAERWVHVGTVEPNTLFHLTRNLVLRGMHEHFVMTGILDRSRYRCLVQGASVVVKPSGEVDTGVGARESNLWGLTLSVPAGYPVEPTKRSSTENPGAGAAPYDHASQGHHEAVSCEFIIDRFCL